MTGITEEDQKGTIFKGTLHSAQGHSYTWQANRRYATLKKQIDKINAKPKILK
jgi:hypothetical protein